MRKAQNLSRVGDISRTVSAKGETANPKVAASQVIANISWGLLLCDKGLCDIESLSFATFTSHLLVQSHIEFDFVQQMM